MLFKNHRAFSVLAILLSLTASPLAAARIIELPLMETSLADVHADTLVIYDLDNTLIRPVQTLGSDQWFRKLVEQAKKNGATDAQATDQAIARWMPVQRATAVQPVEPGTPALVAGLQKQGVVVMGLTARPEALADTTLAQLKSVGYDLSVTAPARETLELPSAHFENGIIFVGPGGDKGEVLKSFLAHIGYTPGSIVFVDDRSGNTDSVERALNTTSIPHLVCRYSAADAWVQSYDQRIADRQWQTFEKTGRLIRDEEI